MFLLKRGTRLEEESACTRHEQAKKGTETNHTEELVVYLICYIVSKHGA